ncbi:MAG: cation transporter [Deltaproteobacteria bacterium]|nr:cation transporter [Deltaproteobacteria bacterium]
MSGHHHHYLGSENHNHGEKNQNPYSLAFLVGISLNFGFVGVEATYGFLSNSVALLADAGHNFGDVIGLVLSWAAIWLSARKSSSRFTYGLRSSSILTALANALLLLAAVGAIVWEAIGRLREPYPIEGMTMIVVATIGIGINAFTAFLFFKGRKGDLNIRSAFLHMFADALVSVGVVLAGFGILWTGWQWIDPLVSLIIALVIVVGTWSLLKESLGLALDAVPIGIETKEVFSFLEKLNGVSKVHDLHIWPMSTTETALTAHLVMPKGSPGDHFLNTVAHEIEEKFHIHHSTIQIEFGDSNHPCELEPEDHV